MGQIISLGAEVPFNFWESRLFTDELMRAASQDPALWPEQAARIANFDVNLRNGSLAWQEGAQLAIKEIAAVSGVPGSIAASISTNIVKLATSRPQTTAQLAEDLAVAGLGVVTNVLSGIPIVGIIAGAIGGMAQLLIKLSRAKVEVAKEYLPPFVDYSEEVDEFVVNTQVLPTLGTLDWTALMLPRYRGGWSAHEREHGWAFRPGAAGGVGFIPGSQRVSGVLQTYFVYKSVRKGFQLAESRDQGSFYPGAAQMLTAAAQQIESPQTQMYNVDTNEIERRWRDYHLGLVEYATDLWNGTPGSVAGNGLSALTEEQRRAVVRAMLAELYVGYNGEIGLMSTSGWTPGNQGTSVFGAIIKPWVKRVRQRQEHYLGTLIGTAYTDPSQAAFTGDQQLALKLKINRGLLLNNSARHQVRTGEMIDANYRKQLFAAAAGGTLAAGPSGPPLRPSVPDASAEPPAGGAPFGWLGRSSSNYKAWIAVGAVAGTMYLAHRKRWI